MTFSHDTSRHGLVIGLAGFSGAGKTTLAEKLIAALCARGHRIATIKHAHDSFEIDTKGKDSYRHRKAGAGEVLIVASRLKAKLTATYTAPDLAALLADLAPADIVLVEGFKNLDFPKIEIRRGDNNANESTNFPGVFLIATDSPPQKQNQSAEAIPFCHIDDIKTIADSIETRMQKGDTP